METRQVLKASDARTTYRYLRIGMVLAAVALGASIAVERSKLDCWQTSISAYYYTPVRAIFVGGMIAVGFSLIVIRGRTTWEDTCLNFAGILAPIVAVAPTTDVGRCWSEEPIPLPLNPDGSLAAWVVSNVTNNFYALLIVGAIAWAIALIIFIVLKKSAPLFERETRTGRSVSVAVTALALAAGWVLIETWNDFYERAHGYAAVLMFVFLIAAVAGKAVEHRKKRTGYFPLYSAVATSMAIGGIAIALFRVGGEHTVFVLEAYEIVLFVVFWVAQTVENWNEEVTTPALPPGTG